MSASITLGTFAPRVLPSSRRGKKPSLASKHVSLLATHTGALRPSGPKKKESPETSGLGEPEKSEKSLECLFKTLFALFSD